MVEGLIRHPPVFCKKRRQAIEIKGREPEKERQERTRGGKLLGIRELRPGCGWQHERRWGNDGKARLKRREESIEKVGEGIVVALGSRLAGDCLACSVLAAALGRLEVASRFAVGALSRSGYQVS